MIKIKHLRESIETNKGYLPFPVVVEEQCPRCNKLVIRDLVKDPPYDPIFNQPFDLWFQHQDGEDCQYEWSVKVVLRAGLMTAQPATFLGWTDPKKKVEVIKVLRRKTECSLMDGKKWVESAPHGISRELAENLEAAGAIIEWKY